MNTKKIQAYKSLILECANFSDYAEILVDPTTEKGIINTLSDIFESEKGYEIKRVGCYQAAKDWFEGLCSVCTVPFAYEDILDFYAGHELDTTFNGEVEMSTQYFTDLGEVFCDMIAGRV